MKPSSAQKVLKPLLLEERENRETHRAEDPSNLLPLNLPSSTQVLARTVAGEHLLKPGMQVELNTPGPLILYPAKDGVFGSPAILLVRARVSASVEGPAEAGVGELVQLKARLRKNTPALSSASNAELKAEEAAAHGAEQEQVEERQQ